ncbi:MAG: toxin-antitoxin system, antitoxin component [Patescibacteria group bacterium]|jgi:hypothetical protein
MPSNKTRINLTVPAVMERDLQRIAKRDDRSLATTALDLLRLALEIEEDGALLGITKQRDKKSVVFVSHASAWK